VMTIGFWWYFSSLWRRLSADPSYRQKRLLWQHHQCYHSTFIPLASRSSSFTQNKYAIDACRKFTLESANQTAINTSVKILQYLIFHVTEQKLLETSSIPLVEFS
jgi:hypothetical protein